MSDDVSRIIVKFRVTPEVDSHALRQLCDDVVRRWNAQLVRPPSATGRALFQVNANSDIGAVIDEIRKLPSVLYVEPEITDRTSLQ